MGYAYLTLFVPEGDVLRCAAERNYPDLNTDFRLSTDRGVIGRVFRTGKDALGGPAPIRRRNVSTSGACQSAATGGESMLFCGM